jgi:undecaprenyl diphosphate synthase
MSNSNGRVAAFKASPIPEALAEAPALTVLPTHVGIIMDGNGRWARRQGLPRNHGHRAGTENIRRVIEAFAEHGIRHLTLYAFSTENWTRPQDEVDFLMDLLREVVKHEAENLNERGARLRHIGRLDQLDPKLRAAIVDAVEKTKQNDRITVTVALNYGGRAELVDAVRSIVRSGVPADQVTEELLERHLYTNGSPDPDMIIRTAGEMRLSNFLTWQASYAEYYATPKFWPDFDKDDVYEALREFGRRRRRFGGLDPE